MRSVMSPSAFARRPVEAASRPAATRPAPACSTAPAPTPTSSWRARRPISGRSTACSRPGPATRASAGRAPTNHCPPNGRAEVAMTPRTMFDKIWDAHVVAEEPGRPAVLYIDLHLVHEVTSPQAFAGLAARGLRVRRPDRTFATMDHSVPTLPKSLAIVDPEGEHQLRTLETSCRQHGIALYGMDSEHQGIVHVIGPELGLTHPGSTIVC